MPVAVETVEAGLVAEEMGVADLEVVETAEEGWEEGLGAVDLEVVARVAAGLAAEAMGAVGLAAAARVVAARVVEGLVVEGMEVVKEGAE